MIPVYKNVIKYTPASLVGGGVFLGMISFIALFPNREVIEIVVADSAITTITKISLVLSLYGSLFSNQTWLSGLVALSTALLVGILAALIIYYIKISRGGRVSKRTSAASVGGVVAGFLGIGCAACGSILVTSLLTGVGATVLQLLPYKGVEIGILGIVLLLYAVKRLLGEIKKGAVCSII